MHKYYKELTAVMWVQVKLWEVLNCHV